MRLILAAFLALCATPALADCNSEIPTYQGSTADAAINQNLKDICNNVKTSGGSNASVGTNGSAAPASSTQIGVQVSGNLQPASSSNPVPTHDASPALPSGGSTAANQTTANTKLDTLHSDLASGGPLDYAKGPSASATRPNNTTTYTANTGWNTATSASSPGYLTFANFCRANGTSMLPTDLLVTDGANQTTKLTGILWIFDTPPTTVINDNATFSISASDLPNVKTFVPFTLSTVANQGSGASGSVMDEETSLGRQLTCAAGDTNLYGMIQVTNAYVPVANEVLTFRLRGIGVN